jgi:hypothetical protein
MTAARSISLAALLGCLVLGPASAMGLADLTNHDAARGIKGALSKGVTSAIVKLGVPGGFLNNPKVKIPLPPALDQLAKAMRMMGRGKDADELVVAMNRAAEQAVPQAKGLMLNAVKSMSIEDAKNILTGGDGCATGHEISADRQKSDRSGGLGTEIRSIRRRGSQTGPGKGQCGQHRNVRHPKGPGWSVSDDRRARTRHQTKSRSGGQRDCLEGVRRIAPMRIVALAAGMSNGLRVSNCPAGTLLPASLTSKRLWPSPRQRWPPSAEVLRC